MRGFVVQLERWKARIFQNLQPDDEQSEVLDPHD